MEGLTLVAVNVRVRKRDGVVRHISNFTSPQRRNMRVAASTLANLSDYRNHTTVEAIAVVCEWKRPALDALIII
jgi:hypothetical protein